MSLNILELCLSPGCGGLELYVKKVTDFFSFHKDFEVLTVVKKNSFLDEKLDQPKLPNNYISVLNRHFPIVGAYQLAKIIENKNIDIIHVHWGKDLFLAVLAKFFCNKDVKLIYMRQMALTRYKNDFYHKFLYKNVDGYHVISKELQKDARKYLPIDDRKIHLLYYGVPAANGNKELCFEYLDKIGLNEEIFKVAIFGRIEKGKGQHLVIGAAKNLIKQGHKIQVIIIGHVMDEKYFQQLESEIQINKLENSIVYAGFHNNPTSIMPCFDAVILASECETFGLVLPEAMRAGVTVIGSNCGGVPEIINHDNTGLLFESGNVEDLTLQLSKIIIDKQLCKKLAAAGKIDADLRFSESNHFEKLISLFKSV